MNSHIVLIANPAARKASREKIEKAADIIKKRGLGLEVLLTKGRGDGVILAKDALGRGASLVIAGGGDGTFNEVANGLAGTNVPMAILPMGTTNVLAKELGVPESIEAAVGAVLSGSIHKVSLGRIAYDSSSRYFFLMAGIGFDGEAVYGVDKKIKKYSGKGGYILSGLKTLLRWNPERLKVSIDGDSYEGYSLIVCNGAKYGGRFKAAPDANIEQPHLYAVLMHGSRRYDLLRYFFGIVTGRHTGFRDVTYRKCRRVEVKGEAHIQADGDYLGKTPASISVEDGALNLVY